MCGGRSSRVLYPSLSTQDLLRGPEGKIVQRDTQSLQLLLTGLQQVVVLLQVTRYLMEISRRTVKWMNENPWELTDDWPCTPEPSRTGRCWWWLVWTPIFPTSRKHFQIFVLEALWQILKKKSQLEQWLQVLLAPPAGCTVHYTPWYKGVGQNKQLDEMWWTEAALV